MTQTITVRTRMAPSPTGEYHVGHIATLLKNYAYAKQHGGQFVLRIEDTDQVRKVEGAVERIMKVIRDYGLDWDEGPDKGGPFAPYTQSERLPLYKEKAEELIQAGKAYYCFCSSERLEHLRDTQREANQPPMYDKHCRTLDPQEAQKRVVAGEPHVIRLAVPENTEIVFHDLIRGKIVVQSSSVDDQVLLKSDNFPTYHLGVVVDDYLMKITHVMRGEEWISSTPKHILLYQAFGWQPPVYAHIPIFLNPDGKGKMSKRKGTVAAQSFIENGYLPEAMLNFFMILGWTPKDQREILTLDEYIQEFNPAEISAKSVVFDLAKLRWLNGMYIRKLTAEQLLERAKPFLPRDFPTNLAGDILPLVAERLEVLSDIEMLTSFFYRPIELDLAPLLKKTTPAELQAYGRASSAALDELSNWTVSSIETAIRSLQESKGWSKGQYFMALRVFVTGKTATPPLFDTMAVLGKERVLDRLKKALAALN